MNCFFFGNYELATSSPTMTGVTQLVFTLTNPPSIYGENTIDISINYTYLGKEQFLEIHKKQDDFTNVVNVVQCDNQNFTIRYAYIVEYYNGSTTNFVDFTYYGDIEKLSYNSFKPIFHDTDYMNLNANAYLYFDFK